MLAASSMAANTEDRGASPRRHTTKTRLLLIMPLIKRAGRALLPPQELCGFSKRRSLYWQFGSLEMNRLNWPLNSWAS